MATISFTTKFNLSTSPKKFQFTDTSDYAGQGISTSNVNGDFAIVAPSGITIYNNTDFTNGGCDIRVSSSVNNQTTIQLPLATNGLPEVGIYKITYTVYDKNLLVYYTVVNTYTYDYIEPEVEISQTVDCLSPLFTSTDVTDYVVNGITPTIAGTHTVYLPAAADISPATASFISAGSVITLGFAAFYNGTQTTVISANLTYTFSDGLIVIDTITGSQEILVDCKDTCGIYCCLRALEGLMMDYKVSNQEKYQETAWLFSQVMAIAAIAQMAIRCGKSNDVSGYLVQIKALAHCTDECSCNDGAPTPVTGLGGLINDVVVVSGDSTIIVTPITVGNTTTYTLTINTTFIDYVNSLYNTIVAQGTNVTVTDSGVIGGVRTFTVNANNPTANCVNLNGISQATTGAFVTIAGATTGALANGTYLIWSAFTFIPTASVASEIVADLFNGVTALSVGNTTNIIPSAVEQQMTIPIMTKVVISSSTAVTIKVKHNLGGAFIEDASLMYFKIA